MQNCPEAVSQIAGDYLERLKSLLLHRPHAERQEFLREIESHIYEAYQREPVADDVARILAVLRKLGEPGDLIAERLPAHRSRVSLPRIAAGIAFALVGLPVIAGISGGVVGVVGGLAGAIAAWYAAAAALLIAGTVLLSLGLLHLYYPGIWERLIAAGIIRIDDSAADVLDQLGPGVEAFLLLLAAVLVLALAVGMFWLGRHLLRGLRVLVTSLRRGIPNTARGIRAWLTRPDAARYEGDPEPYRA